MRIPFGFLFLIFVLPAVVAQKVMTVRTIQWLSPVFNNTRNDKPVLRFRGAVYDDPRTRLPQYSELIAIPSNSEIDEVSIVKPEYSPADSLESIILGSANLDTFIKVKSETGTAREQNYLQVTFIPLRRNPVDGRLE
jgi:hypothetical protein